MSENYQINWKLIGGAALIHRESGVNREQLKLLKEKGVFRKKEHVEKIIKLIDRELKTARSKSKLSIKRVLTKTLAFPGGTEFVKFTGLSQHLYVKILDGYETMGRQYKVKVSQGLDSWINAVDELRSYLKWLSDLKNK